MSKLLKIAILLYVIYYFMHSGAIQRREVKKGNKLYQDGNYEESLGEYNAALEKDENNPIVNFDAGAASYKLNDYESAKEHFLNALLTEDEELKQRVHYNLGNTFYQMGKGLEEKNINGAIERLEESLQEYEKSIALNRNDSDAKGNYDFVKEELKKMKKKQEEQQKQNQQNQNNENQQQNQNNNQNNQSRQQNQQQDQSQDQQQNQQNNQPDQQDKEQDQSQDQQNQQDSQDEQNNQDNDADDSQQDTQPLEGKEISEKEAQMLLQKYQQNEEPKGLLHMVPVQGREHKVENDW